MRLFLKLYYYWAMKKICELKVLLVNGLSYFIMYYNDSDRIILPHLRSDYLAELPVSMGRKCIHLSEFYKSRFSAEFQKIKHLEDEKFSF